ncbi:MAG TPA: ABC transporter permease [Stellaceae bacterium]|nr:ABC transporter permease [Stellaceae bacterium]
MIELAPGIALKHLLARRRQSLVSLSGIVLGVAFFLAVSSLMQGSENDFIRRLVDNSPHITIQDEFRNPRLQPVEQLYPAGAVEVRRVKPLTETRGIRGYPQVLAGLRTLSDLRASPVLVGQGLASFAGKDIAVTLNGMIPAEVGDVTTIRNYMISGSVDELIANPDGIILGDALVRKLSLALGENVTVTAPTGEVHTFRILGLFHTGRANYDETQTFADLKRVQALLKRLNRANNIILKLEDPHRAQAVAGEIEGRFDYKSVSWQEANEDLMSTLTTRNIIMYTVVSAVLIVAAFGIYNVISTVVLEKQRDIAILKSMGFRARDIQHIFLIQGILLGLAGSALGLPFGAALMLALMQIRLKFPGSSDLVPLPIDWNWYQFAIAAAFAMGAALCAGLLPARKAASVQPVDILRGAQ